VRALQRRRHAIAPTPSWTCTGSGGVGAHTALRSRRGYPARFVPVDSGRSGTRTPRPGSYGGDVGARRTEAVVRAVRRLPRPPRRAPAAPSARNWHRGPANARRPNSGRVGRRARSRHSRRGLVRDPGLLGPLVVPGARRAAVQGSGAGRPRPLWPRVAGRPGWGRVATPRGLPGTRRLARSPRTTPCGKCWVPRRAHAAEASPPSGGIALPYALPQRVEVAAAPGRSDCHRSTPRAVDARPLPVTTPRSAP